MKTILVDAVDTFISDSGEIFNEMRTLLDSFENNKIILTGAPHEKFQKYSLDKVPYKVFTTQHNPPKTNEDYYKIMLKELNLKVDEIIYFEHNLEAVESARKNGILTYHYDKDKKDLVGLKEFLENNLI